MNCKIDFAKIRRVGLPNGEDFCGSCGTLGCVAHRSRLIDLLAPIISNAKHLRDLSWLVSRDYIYETGTYLMPRQLQKEAKVTGRKLMKAIESFTCKVQDDELMLM